MSKGFFRTATIYRTNLRDVVLAVIVRRVESLPVPRSGYGVRVPPSGICDGRVPFGKLIRTAHHPQRG
ncbi:MAG: hypothetical protein NTV38_14165, partial [Chloroflexi bacterium]|nr:hypothetical protein [Chloroflexota bacterium]